MRIKDSWISMSSKADKKRILKLIKSKILIERLDAIHELKSIGEEADFAVSDLIKVVKKDSDDLARINALDVLASLSDISQQVIDVIEASLNYDSIGVQKKAEKILANIDKSAQSFSLPSESEDFEEVSEPITEESPEHEGFFEPVKEEQLQNTASASINDNEVSVDWQFEEFGVGETTDLSSTNQLDDTTEMKFPQTVSDDPVVEPRVEEAQIEDLATPEVEEEKEALLDEVIVEEEIKAPRDVEKELELKELGDKPFPVSVYNLTLLFETLNELKQVDEKNRSYVYLRINESLDKLIEHLYQLIGITAEEEWQKFIAFEFNTGDKENLRKIISLLASQVEENKCDFCILSYLVFMGSLAQKIGMIDETIVFYEFILNQDSSNLIVLHNLGMLYGKLGQPDEAIKQFKKIIEREPNNALAHARVGDLLFYEKKEFEEAKEYYLKVLELDLKRFSSGINLAAIYGKSENYAEATTILHKCLKVNPKESDLWLNYAILMVKQQKFHEAIEAYSKALEVAPEDWKFRDRAKVEKTKVEEIISSKEYLEVEKEDKSVKKERHDIGKLFNKAMTNTNTNTNTLIQQNIPPNTNT
ncbi:MAG: tetratricopeptide repeat protein, partial [Candidatus Heimdallarchaeota archaeon]|nr:tetratricopeptide repeat protein [Candidatus Heimdallarchaeota archaeon]